jgi:hypothetical protein
VTIGGRCTIAAIAVTAFALCDLVHEVIGHGLAVLLVPGVSAISLSSVALQTTGESRFVAAAGSLANIVIGSAALVHFHRQRRFSPNMCFLWLFAAVNLLNGSGYPLYSAILGSGDWAVVVKGLEPALAWRTALGVMGAAAYAGAVVLSAGELARVVENNSVERRDSWSRPAGVCSRQHAAGRRVGIQSDWPESYPVVRCQQWLRCDGWTGGYSAPG